MPAVELLRVHAVEVAHQARQVVLLSLQYQVVVVAHQAVGQHLGIEAVHRLGEDVELGDPVRVVAVDRLASVTA